VVNGSDPLNLVGTITPGATVPAIRTREVVYIDGVSEDVAVGLDVAPGLDARTA
jgi:hypothetical protein